GRWIVFRRIMLHGQGSILQILRRRGLMPSAVNNNQSGYSLVIVMIILGVMSTIAAGTTSMIRNQVLEQSTNRFHQESKNIMADVQNNFLNEAACTKTFENLVLNAATEAVASNIFDEESSVLYSK